MNRFNQKSWLERTVLADDETSPYHLRGARVQSIPRPEKREFSQLAGAARGGHTSVSKDTTERETIDNSAQILNLTSLPWQGN